MTKIWKTSHFHNSIVFTDSILYISILASFFWLNSMGYYIWKTFRSRNVFLRVTDGRKYCWYSFYVWGSTALMAGIAIFAHFYLDSPISKRHKTFDDEETFGNCFINMLSSKHKYIFILANRISWTCRIFYINCLYYNNQHILLCHNIEGYE
jgi:G protein-coupled receptor Mth (Methuselah protein)